MKLFHDKININKIKINQKTKFLIEEYPDKVNFVDFISFLYPRVPVKQIDRVGDLEKRVDTLEKST